MASSSQRHSATAQLNVNLYCSQCESQIGIFENEWIRLTSSYGRSKAKGIHFATEVGNRTQVVPSGPAQRSAEGCVMAEVFCRKCSNMVGQYCKSAPDIEKQPLVDQYFYKFSRTFLKDSRTMARVDPAYGYGSDIFRPVGSQSSALPRNGSTPTSKWANTPMRQSSRTPAMSSQKAVSSSMPQTEPRNDGRKQPLVNIQQLQEEVRSQALMIAEQSERIDTQTIRLDEQEACLEHQESKIEDQASCSSAQAAKIVEQNTLIKMQAKRLEIQQSQLGAITNQLSKLMETMDDLRSMLVTFKTNPAVPVQDLREECEHPDDDSMETINKALSTANELAAFDSQNQLMKSRLAAFASVVERRTNVSNNAGVSEGPSTAIPPSRARGEIHTLGKRKRGEAVRPVSIELGGSAPLQNDKIAPHLRGPRQMPTPQASEEGQHSPVQSLSDTMGRAGNQMSNAQTRRKTGEQVVEEDSAPSSRPSDLSVVKRRKRGRRARSQNAKEVNASDDDDDDDDEPFIDTSIDVLGTENRRVTRASTRATRLVEVDNTDQYQVTEWEVPSPNCSASSMQIDEARRPVTANPAPSPSPSVLPSVRTTSNILDASVAALSSPSKASMHQTDDPSYLSDHPSNCINLSSDAIKLPSHNPREQICNSAESQVNGAQSVSVHDSGIRDLVDADDDENDLDITETMSLSEWINPTLLGTSKSNHAHGTENQVILHGSQTKAPESDQLEKPIAKSTERHIILDGAHAAKAEVSTEARAVERQSKDVKPRRSRELYDELKLLGLSHWIDRDRRCKEYRQEVSAAREKLRMHNKAMFLQSAGFDNNTSIPSSVHVESPSCSEDIVADPSAPVIENATATTATMIESVQTDDPPASEAGKSPEQQRVTRASLRRSSARLLSGLEEVETLPITESEPKQVRSNGRSDGRGKSQRKSEINDRVADVSHADQIDTEQDGQQVDQDVDNVSSAAVDETGVNLEPTIEGDVANKSSLAKTSSSKTESRAKKLEEAILLRDRMARELMESEDMGM